MRIIHLSDLHICVQHRKENIAKVDQLLSRAVDAGADHIAITGDISHLGRIEDLVLLRDLLRKHHLYESSRVSLTIGNHDIYGGIHFVDDIFNFPDHCFRTNYMERVMLFHETFRELFDNTITIRAGNPFPYLKIVDDTAFIGLNSVATYSYLRNPMASNGIISTSQLNDLETLLQDTRVTSRKKILLVHHHFSMSGKQEGSFLKRIEHHTMKLHNRKRLMRLLSKNAVDLTLHGHVHTNNEYVIKGNRFVNGGASVDGHDKFILNMNIIDVDPDHIHVLSHQIVNQVRPKEEFLKTGNYIPSFAG